MMNHSLSTDELLRYSRQIKLKEIGVSGQEKLKNTRVLCVGLGGLGSSLLLYLSAAGVGRLGLVDADTVELSNLQRQVLYRHPDISSSKTRSALEQILALNPGIQVDTYTEMLTEKNAPQLIEQYDIVADCSDNFYTNYVLHDLCFKQKKPYVYASISQFKGYCSLFHGNEGPCFRCLFPIPPDPNRIPSCEEAGVLGVVPGLLGTIQATEIIKWVLEIGLLLENRLLIVDLFNMAFKEIKLVQNPDCHLCMHQKPLDKLSYPPTPEHCFNSANYSITSEDMYTLLNDNAATLIDVRSTEEHEAQNIGGKTLPLSELADRLHELDPDQTFILYCHSGPRSIIAVNLLLKAGFSSVKYLIGGLSERN